MTAVKVQRIGHEFFALVAALSACCRACPKLFMKIERTLPLAPLWRITTAMWETLVTKQQMTSTLKCLTLAVNSWKDNYFHKQSILGIEIFTDQKTIQDGAMQYFCCVNGGGSFVYETFVPIYSTSCVTAQTD